jgi:hypothetical protein
MFIILFCSQHIKIEGCTNKGTDVYTSKTQLASMVIGVIVHKNLERMEKKR